MKRQDITLPAQLYDRLKELGDGNVSKGVRFLAQRVEGVKDAGEDRVRTTVTIPEETADQLREFSGGSVSRALACLIQQTR